MQVGNLTMVTGCKLHVLGTIGTRNGMGAKAAFTICDHMKRQEGLTIGIEHGTTETERVRADVGSILSCVQASQRLGEVQTDEDSSKDREQCEIRVSMGVLQS